jgi:uncharacterized protein (DUF1330 family)
MNDATAPAYLMVQIKSKDHDDTMQRYGRLALATVAQFGGELLAGTPTPSVLEGEWDGNWAAVLRFPSMAMAQAWYDSPQYRPLKDLRINELTESNRVLLIEGADPVSSAR